MQWSTAGQERGEGLLTSDPTLFQNLILIPNKACKLMTQFFPRGKAVSGTVFWAHLHVSETRALGLNHHLPRLDFLVFQSGRINKWFRRSTRIGPDLQFSNRIQQSRNEHPWDYFRGFALLYSGIEESHTCTSYVFRRFLLPSAGSAGWLKGSRNWLSSVESEPN